VPSLTAIAAQPSSLADGNDSKPNNLPVLGTTPLQHKSGKFMGENISIGGAVQGAIASIEEAVSGWDT
jgi:hypothetical protein